jgi:hypothetical protein
MEIKEYFTDSKGNKLSAILASPSDSIMPVVILCHGLNSNKDANSNKTLSKKLFDNNIATFRFDFFAHGESEGKIEDRTTEKFVDDILSAINNLKNKGYKHIGIYGASFGGMSSVIAASKSKDIEFIVLKAAGMGQSRNMKNYEQDFNNKTWIKAGEKINIPTLIIHGSKDEEVELQLGIDLSKAIKSSKLIILENADHRFTKKEDFDKSIEMMLKFIVENIHN